MAKEMAEFLQVDQSSIVDSSSQANIHNLNTCLVK